MICTQFESARRLLLLGAHSDDIEIGCGGTVLEWVKRNPRVSLCWVVFSAEGKRQDEARQSAAFFTKEASGTKVVVHNFRGSFFPYQGEAIKEAFETLKRGFQPDVVFTHYRDDRHQDHRVISDLTWNTFRNHVVLEYEIPKYDGDIGQPNCFVSLSGGTCRRKATAITRFFQTQSNKHWFTEDTFLALMRLRGIECAAKTKYAEAFYARKLLLA